MINDKVELNKIKSFYEIQGCYVWHYGIYCNNLQLRDNKLINIENNNVYAEGIRNIKRYLRIFNYELEKN